MDLHTNEKLFNFLLDCLSHRSHNVVTAALETLHQQYLLIRGPLLLWVQEPPRILRCVRLLIRFLLTDEKHRVRWVCMMHVAVATRACDRIQGCCLYILPTGPLIRHRCSVKALAVSCLGDMLAMLPFLIYLQLDEGEVKAIIPLCTQHG